MSGRMILVGASGRMGHEIAARAGEAGFAVVAGVDVNPCKADFPIYPSLDLCHEEADVIVDFARPEGLHALLRFAQSRGLPLLLCSTGYNDADMRQIQEAAETLPVFQSANLSLGVYVLKALAQKAKELLPSFDIEIIEKHHNQKLDAPSGTAYSLLAAISDADTEPVFGRHTRTEKRDAHEIGVHAIRGGTVAGVHEVGFYGKDETITLTHEAQSRAVFAYGALRAARFMLDKPAGLYGMKELAEGN